MVAKGFLMQTISKEKIEELRIIFKKEFGKSLDDATIQRVAGWLLNYFILIVDIEKEKNETPTKQ